MSDPDTDPKAVTSPVKPEVPPEPPPASASRSTWKPDIPEDFKGINASILS